MPSSAPLVAAAEDGVPPSLTGLRRAETFVTCGGWAPFAVAVGCGIDRNLATSPARARAAIGSSPSPAAAAPSVGEACGTLLAAAVFKVLAAGACVALFPSRTELCTRGSVSGNMPLVRPEGPTPPHASVLA